MLTSCFAYDTILDTETLVKPNNKLEQAEWETSGAPFKKTIHFSWSACYWLSRCTLRSEIFPGQLLKHLCDQFILEMPCVRACVYSNCVTSERTGPTVSNVTNQTPVIPQESRGSYTEENVFNWMYLLCSVCVFVCTYVESPFSLAIKLYFNLIHFFWFLLSSFYWIVLFFLCF